MKCPMYDSCTLKTGGCVASLPDDGCYWYRFFKDLIQKTENPWHTGTPTEEGWYLIAFNYEFEEGVRYTTDYLKDGKWAFPMVRDISKIRAWMPITPFEEKENGRTD